jgi:hypothetical protein
MECVGQQTGARVSPADYGDQLLLSQAANYSPGMLYLHCGWPRTGTTSLQANLSRQRDRLAAAGTVYPDVWLSAESLSHHGIARFADGTAESRARRAEFTDYLAARSRQDVLLSAEGTASWLRSDDTRGPLLELLAAAGEVTPVRCVWVLRRVDRLLESLYLLKLLLGRDPPPPPRYFEQAGFLRSLFPAMAALEAVPGVEVRYVRYDPGGAHNRELLGALGVAETLAAEIAAGLERGRRLYTSISHKQAVTIANRDALSAALGGDLGTEALFRAFKREGLSFDGDRPCELVDAGLGRRAHERALVTAREHGIHAYAEFFAGAEIRPRSTTPLDIEAVGEDDLRRLADHLGLEPVAR